MSAVDTRNVSRDSLFLFAELAFDGRVGLVRAKVRNLSAGGMMAESGVAAGRGERITVRLRNIGEVKGTVAWVHGNRFGIAFDCEIDPQLARAPVSAGDNAASRYPRPGTGIYPAASGHGLRPL